MKRKRLQTKIALWAGGCLLVTSAIIVAYAAMMIRTQASVNRRGPTSIPTEMSKSTVQAGMANLPNMSLKCLKTEAPRMTGMSNLSGIKRN